MQKTLLFFVSLLLFSSCHITQRYTFNRDFSGEVLHIVDYSRSFDNAIGIVDENENFEEPPLDSLEAMDLKKAINAIEGISGALLSIADNKIELACDFENIESLNKLLADSLAVQDGLDQFCSFKRDGKKVIVHFDTQKLNKPEKNESSDFNIDSESFSDAITYRFEFYFEQGIKKAKGPKLTKLEDGKTVAVEQTLTEMSKPEFKNELKIKLR